MDFGGDTDLQSITVLEGQSSTQRRARTGDKRTGCTGQWARAEGRGYGRGNLVPASDVDGARAAVGLTPWPMLKSVGSGIGL